MEAPSNTTAGNTGRVAGYGGFAFCVVYALNKRTGINLDDIEFAAAVYALTVLATFVWNYAKDLPVLGDNR